MAQQDPDRNPQDRNVEEPGDTNAGDIVGRTGEQMPRQSHDGLDEREPDTRVNEAGGAAREERAGEEQ